MKKSIIKSLEDILFPVKKVPLADYLKGDNLKLPRKRAYVILTEPNPGDLQVVNFCSKGYHLLTNKEIVDLFVEPFLEAMGDTTSINCRVEKNSRFYIDFISNTGIPIGDRKLGDLVNPRVSIQNSYDGSIKFGVSFGAHRLICKNGLSIPENVSAVKFMHTPSLGYNHVNKAVDSLQDFLKSFKDLSENYTLLVNTRPTLSLEGTIDEVIKGVGYPRRLKQGAMERALMEMGEYKLPLTNWLVYNAMNFELNHNKETKLATNKKVRLDQRLLSFLTRNKHGKS